jgi:glucosamine-6-phosphate deaminase
MAWVKAAASWWRDRLNAHPRLSMCLPSGLTPNPLYAEMAASVRKGQVSFARAAVWVLDEFGDVAREDPGRCVNMLRRNLVSGIDLPAEGFHFLEPADPDIEDQCRRYEPRDGFELVLLGLGTNGHLGMNEPGSRADSPTRRVELHASTIEGSARYFSHGRLPDWGVTVGLHAILGASEVWLLASGESKAEIVRRTVSDRISDDVPASLLRRHPNCSLFVDTAAASLL